MNNTFFTLGAEHLLDKDNQLVKLSKLINWEAMRSLLKGIHVSDDNESSKGRKPYDPVQMLKAVLLGQWHSLSDPELARSLKLRIDFMLFCGFDLQDNFPDDTTLCRFRNKVFKHGKAKHVFDEINRQLEVNGLNIKNAKGAVIDATIIESAARPKRHVEHGIAEDRKELEQKIPPTPTILDSKDADAAWLKKGKKSQYGYKGFVSVDDQYGFVQNIETTAANVYEGHQMESLIEPLNIKAVYADKAYATKSNREHLQERKLKDRVLHKATRGNPLSKRKKQHNKLISKRRFIIEQCFGTLKRIFDFKRAIYMGLDKVNAQIHMKLSCFNLLKAINMMPA